MLKPLKEEKLNLTFKIKNDKVTLKNEYINKVSRNLFKNRNTIYKNDKYQGKIISLNSLCISENSDLNENNDKLQMEILPNYTMYPIYESNLTTQASEIKNIYDSFKSTNETKIMSARENLNVIKVDTKKIHEIYRKGIKMSFLLKNLNTNKKDLPIISKYNHKKHEKIETKFLLKEKKEIKKVFQTYFNEYNNSDNKDIDKIIRNDVSYTLENNFQLFGKSYFNNKYRDVFSYSAQEMKKEQDYKDKIDKLLNNRFDNKFKELNQLINKNKEDIRHELIRKTKKVIISAAIHFLRLNLTLSEFYSKQHISLTPYEKKGSQEFFKAIKEGNSEFINKILLKNKFLVHDFDYYCQTPLHWAAKRGQYHLIPLLLKYGAFIDAEDHFGETPLFFAVKRSQKECVRILLSQFANPNTYNKDKKTALDIAADEEIKYNIRIYKAIYKIYCTGNAKSSFERLRSGVDLNYNIH